MKDSNKSKKQLLDELAEQQREIVRLNKILSEVKKSDLNNISGKEIFRDFFESSPDYCYMISKSGELLNINKTALSILGYKKQEIIGKQFLPLIYTKDSQKKAKLLFEKWNKTGRLINEELTIKTKSGEEKIVLLSVGAIISSIGDLKSTISIQRDITERIQVEKLIKESESHLRELYQKAPMVYQSLDQNAHILEINDAWIAKMGFSRDEIIGTWFGDLLVPGQQKYFKKNYHEFIEIGKSEGIEYELIKKNGSKIIISLSGQSVVEQNGRFLRSHCIIHDITERKQAEEKIKFAEEQLRTAFNQAAIGMVLISPDDHFITVNNYFEKLVGYSGKELKKMTFQYLTHPDDYYIGAEIVKNILNGKSKQGVFEKRYIKKDGKIVFVRLSTVLVRDDKGKPLHFFTQVENITERKNAEQEIINAKEESEKVQSIYRMAIENAEGVPYKFDYHKDSYEFVGDNVKSLLGIEAKYLTVKKMKELVKEIVITDSEFKDSKYIGKYTNAFKTNRVKQYNADFRIVLPTGKNKWISDCAIPIKNEEGTKVVASLGILQDITQRKLSEQNLAKKEHYYRSMLNQLHEDVMVINKDYIITDMNNSMLVTSGYKKEDVIGKTCYKISHGYSKPCDQEGELCPLMEVFKSGKPVSTLHEHIVENGGKAWLDLLFSTLKNADGKVTHVIESARNVTDMYKMQDALRENEQLYRDLVEKAEIAILIEDINGNFTYFNDRFLKIFGYTRKELEKQSNATLVHPEDLKIVQTYHKNRIAGKKAPRHYEARGIKKDGSVIYLSFDVVEIKNGKITGTRSYIQDITERRLIHEQLRKLSVGIEQSPVSVMITDLKGTIEYVNPNFTKVTGYTIEEAKGQNPRILKSGEQPPEFYKKMWDKLLKGEIWRGEFHNKTKNGELFWEEATIGPITNDHGEITHYIGLKEDITNRKKLEEQLLQSQKLEAIGQLAGGVAHDFNNLLTIINGYSGLLIEKYDDESLKKNLHQIQVAGEKAAALTQQLLAFSRKQLIQPSVININHVVHETEKMLIRLIGADINLNCVLDEEVGYIKADTGQINQIIMNLTLNARDAMPRGGILTIETKSVVINEFYSEMQHLNATPGKYVKLSVSDNGIGMTDEIKSKIFEPFFTTKELGKGTGLGLSTVYGIVKQNNGYIWVYSEPQKGTTFKVYLPVLEEEYNITSSELKDTDIKGGSETILVVEDESAVRKIVTEMLCGSGYNVLEAKEAIKAIKITKQNKIHLLMTDIIMPGMSGTTLAIEIKRLRPKIKVLFISGYSDDIVARQGILNEDLPFIQKPFSKENLLRIVRKTLDKD